MQPTPHSKPAVTVATGPPSAGSTTTGPPLQYYSRAHPGGNLHHPTRQKLPAQMPAFDFSIPEDRLLQTQYPRVALPRNSPPLPHRASPLRILPNWGLTNGVNVVNIDCMRAGNHSTLRPGFVRLESIWSRAGAGEWGRGSYSQFGQVHGRAPRRRGSSGEGSHLRSRAKDWESARTMVGMEGWEGWPWSGASAYQEIDRSSESRAWLGQRWTD
jgi:hypothetical protein